MPNRQLSNWIKAYLDFTSNMEAPKLFRMWSGISAIAGALRGKCLFNMGHFVWKPNFYIIFVAPPGIATKSTSFGVSTSLLSKAPGVNFGPDSVTWQALTEYMAEEAREEIQINGSFVPMSNVTLALSELGSFLDPTNGEMVDVLTDLWDGRDSAKPWTRRTKGGGEEVIPQPFINLIAGTTPGWIHERMTEYGISGGLSSRTVYVYADKKAKLDPYPFLTARADFEELRAKLVADLIEIAKISGEFSLSREGLEWGIDWYEGHWTRTPDHLNGERLGGYRSRKQGHLHKIAMVLSAAQRNDRKISRQDLIVAEQILAQAEVDMHKVFSIISSGTENAKTENRILLGLGAVSGAIEQTQFYRERMVMYMGYQDFERSVSSLVSSGQIGRRRDGTFFLIWSNVKDNVISAKEPKL